MTISLNPAPTAWASDTNYSSGPANGTATKVDPGAGRFAQGWVPGDTLPAQHINFHLNAIGASLADIVSKVSGNALDAIGGGSYTPTAAISFLGTRSVNFHTASIDAGGTFTVAPTGKIDVAPGGAIEINDPGDLKIDSVISDFRLSLTPQSNQPDTGGVDASWRPVLSGVAFAGTVGGWYQHDVNFAACIAFPLNLNPGDEILTVVAQVDGSVAGVDHAAKPTGGDLPVLALVRVDGTGVATVVARRADPSSDLAAYNALHTITLVNGSLDAGTLPHTVLDTDAYYVVLHGETGANAEADKYGVRSISGTHVARSYRTALVPL